MSTFTDDFNRGDGGLSNNWVVDAGAGSITSNHATGTASTRLRQTTISASGRQEGIATLTVAALADLQVAPMLKSAGATGGGYTCYASGTLASPVWHVRRLSGGSFVTDTTVGGSGVSAGEHTLRFLYSDGLLTLWFDGTLIMNVFDNTHDANAAAGVYFQGGSSALNAITVLGDETTTFSVSPTPIPNYGSPTTVTFTGVGTNWSAGTPGTPTFAVDHGTLSDQEVLSTTSATAIYTPGNFLGTARFTDPSTAAFCDVLVTSNTAVIPPNIAALSPYAVAMLNNTAGESLVEQLTKPNTPIDVDAYASLDLETILGNISLQTGATINPASYATSGAIYALWQILNGNDDPPEGPFPEGEVQTLRGKLEHLQARWAATPDPWTVQQVVEALGGSPVIYSNSDIMDALGNISGTDLQPVLDAIAAAQGDPLATIKATMDLVYLLDPTGTHNLAEVLTAISNVRGSGSPDLAAVMAKLGQVQPSTGVTLSSLNLQGVDLQSLLDTLALVIGVVAPEYGTVAEVIALIYDAVTGEAPAAANAGPPVWIDEEHATIDSPIALSDGLIIEGPMDGVLVTITGSPSGATKFTFGETDSWRYVGAVIFETDRGDAEWSQPIGLEAQIVTPRTMQHASAARFRVSSGWTGTVRAFSVTAGA